MWKFCPAWASGSVVCGGRVDMWRLRIAISLLVWGGLDGHYVSCTP